MYAWNYVVPWHHTYSGYATDNNTYLCSFWNTVLVVCLCITIISRGTLVAHWVTLIMLSTEDNFLSVGKAAVN